MKRLYLLFLLTANFLPAQKIVEKSIINPDIRAISLDVTNNFKVSVSTVAGNEMLLEASIDGEYSKDLLVNVAQSGNTLLVSTGFSPNFVKPNDKLSAHKVISIALKVSLPERKSVSIYGTGCHVAASGDYEMLKISLSDGRCNLKNIRGSAKVSTQSGSISVLAESAKIKALSKYGHVGKNHIPLGDTFYDISSVTGDIILDKIE
ncbi:MAG: hypothetical protein WBG48_15730 [Pricia sp.]